MLRKTSSLGNVSSNKISIVLKRTMLQTPNCTSLSPRPHIITNANQYVKHSEETPRGQGKKYLFQILFMYSIQGKYFSHRSSVTFWQNIILGEENQFFLPLFDIPFSFFTDNVGVISKRRKYFICSSRRGKKQGAGIFFKQFTNGAKIKLKVQ